MTEPTFGRDLIAALPVSLLERPIVVTQPEPWPLVAHHFDAAKTQLHMVDTLEREAVEHRTAAFDPGSAVFGVGGGAALDHAKHVAWKRDLPLVLAPSALSTDAAFTSLIALREEGRVRYAGGIHPQHLLIDFSLLQAAPPVLNRSGVGEILSIYTALWDWRTAHERAGDPYDAQIAAEAWEVFDKLLSQVFELRVITESGLKMLASLFLEEVRLCERAGDYRPHEGSEHFLAYCIEARTGKHFLHGRLVSLCTCLVADYQGQDVRRIRAFLRDLGLECNPGALGLSQDDLRDALLSMDKFLEEEPHLPKGVFHFHPCTPGKADNLLDAL